MNLALAPYLFTLFLSVTVCWFIAFYAWRRRQINAAAHFGFVMFAAGFWAFFYGLELIATTLPTKLFWFNLKQIGASLLGPGLLLFALQFTRLQVQYPRLLKLVLLFEPIGTQLIFWTNALHGWAGSPVLITDIFPFPLLYFEYGPWFWFSIFAGYLLFTVATLILAIRLPQANKIYRGQLAMLLVGLLIPWLAGSLSLFGLNNLELFDVTTFLFPVSGLFIGLSLFRYQLLQLTPVAYAAVFSSIRDGIIVIGDDGRIIELNPAALRLLGMKERELINRHITEVLPLQNPHLLHKGNPEEAQNLKFYHEQGGQYRYLEVHGAKIISSVYKATGHVLIIYDVTDRTLAEKARQFSEDRYRTIFETNSAAIVILEEDMTISLANERFTALSGYSRPEIEGKMPWTRFVHEEDLPRMQAYHRERRQRDGSPPSEYEFRFISREDDVKDVHVSVALVPDSKISVASLLDITDRKLAEQVLQQRATDLEAAVRSEQERSEIILQSVSDAIAVSNLKNKIVYINPAFARLTGYSMGDLSGKSPSFVLNGRLPQPIWKSLQRTLLHQNVWEGEVQFKRKNGTVYDAAIRIAPLRDGNGQTIGHVSSHRDITEAKRTEESRRRFVTNISHELRTPVTNIKLYTDLLHRHFDSTRRSQYFEVLNTQIERLETIIQSTLDIVDLENKRDTLHREFIHWESLSENLQVRLQAQANAKQISLKFDPDIIRLPSILGDERRLSQALYELIHNALTFTQSGGLVQVSGTVQRAEDDIEWLTISVCDDGPGISANEQELVFDRFFRGNRAATGNIPGTGLGLSMVKLIAEAHNGRLTLQSAPGQGSTFTLWLPLP